MRKAFLLCGLLFVIYNINFGSLGGNDTTPARYLPFSMLYERDFDLDEFKFLYKGQKLPYYLIASHDRRHAYSTFGAGSAATAFPIYFFPMLLKKKWTWWETVALAKVAASLMVAFSCLFLFLALKHWLSENKAFWLTLIYGLGTCVWSISSQELWQHTSSEFFLILSIYFLIREKSLGAGLSLGAAFVCRPTNLLVAALLFVYLLVRQKKVFYLALIGFLLVGSFQFFYNYHVFKDPFQFGQTKISEKIAQIKTGDSNVWQTPFWKGFLGLTISPSRGLFVYSPFMLFIVWGFYLVWRSRDLLLKFLSLGGLVIVLIASKWFDWWGGWSYGYRPIVDSCLFLIFLLVPVLSEFKEKRILRSVFIGCVVFSIYVQFMGAFFYDGHSWNGTPDVDFHQERLWSVRDSQLLYYLRHPKFKETFFSLLK